MIRRLYRVWKTPRAGAVDRQEATYLWSQLFSPEGVWGIREFFYQKSVWFLYKLELLKLPNSVSHLLPFY